MPLLVSRPSLFTMVMALVFSTYASTLRSPIRSVMSTRTMPKRRHASAHFRDSILAFHPAVFRGHVSRTIGPQIFGYTKLSPRIRNKCTVQFVSKFEVGDEVLIDWDDDGNTSYKSGTIEEVRGGGWYTLCLDSDAIRIKRRGSHLQKKDLDTEMTNLPIESLEVPLPDVEIIDLDLMLHDAQTDVSADETIQKNHCASSTSIDRDTIEQLKSCHSKYTRWVVFSDLHVMPSTLSTCIQVLDFVHSVAVERNAGILFLGDFWHHRGFVRVDCLNAVLEVMSKWTVPSIMIPGNHDQINWTGTEHALTPLRNAYRVNCGSETKQYPGPLILSHPTKFMDALFVPHTRDKMAMKAILASDKAATSSALFVHADVKGASMNDLIKSQHGIEAENFPRGRSVYSGHFHKPHIISVTGGSKIRYVGSPYQTSLAEAAQSKYLLLVNAQKGWVDTETIAIDVGPRYHKFTSVSSFLQCDKDISLRSGDKVSLVVPQQELDEMRDTHNSDVPLYEAKINELRDAGISVEIRNVQSESVQNIAPFNYTSADNERLEIEDLSPEATLAAYIKNEIAAGALEEGTADKLLANGLAIMNELSNETSHKEDKATHANNPIAINLESITIAGFGSFRKQIYYPLSDRGVVLLRGSNQDFGSDSNGVGKSTLAMSSLWALIGSLDTRPVQDGKVADVVNDFSKVAEVTLRGLLNSKPFLVKRTKNMSTGSSLSFVLDGSDLTLQSVSDTQKLINQYFAPEPQLLARSIFHGQHTIGSLLESSDVKLKDELSTLVSVDIWQKAASFVRSKHRDVQRKVSELDGMLLIRKRDAEKASDKCKSAEEEMNSRITSIAHKRKSLIERQVTLSQLESQDFDASITAIQSELSTSNAEITTLEQKLDNLSAANRERIIEIRSKLDKYVHASNQAENHLHQSQRNCDEKKGHLSNLENQLNAIISEWNFKDSNQTIAAARSICRTCGQPIRSQETLEFIRKSTTSKINDLTTLVTRAKEEVINAQLSKHQAMEEAAVMSENVHVYKEMLQTEEESLALQSQSLRDELNEARRLQVYKSSEYSSLVRQAQELSQSTIEQSTILSELQRLDDTMRVVSDSHSLCLLDLESIEHNISEIEKDKEDMILQISSYASLTDVFGSKGIQTFVLRNMVNTLQHYSQSYLDELSDGSLQLVLQVGANDNIIKQAKTLNGDGTWRTRSLSSLSGGQWRRCSLSLSLGFVDLASHRGKLRSSLLVLDEPLTHLDSSGRDSVGKLLRKMLNKSNLPGSINRQLGGLGLSTIIVILQDIAAEEMEECFDYIDEIIKSNGESYVVLDSSEKSQRQ